MFGVTNSDNETVPAVIERELNREGKGPPFVVRNFGVVGYTVWQDFLNFQIRLASMPKPDTVIFINGHNDFNLAWLANDTQCERLFEIAVGGSRIFSEAWETRSQGGAIEWGAIGDKLVAAFPGVFELQRLVAKSLSMAWANGDVDRWKSAYRKSMAHRMETAEACVSRQLEATLRTMQMIAALSAHEGIDLVYVPQPILIASKKTFVGVERSVAKHLDDAFFALSEAELNEMAQVSSVQLGQLHFWNKEKYITTYETQKLRFMELAQRNNVLHVDVDKAIASANDAMIFSSSIHYTKVGAEVIGVAISRAITDNAN